MTKRRLFISSVQKELASERAALRDFLRADPKIARSVGTRAQANAVPIDYELPREAVSEAIVNAVAHRDYSSNASVQVMLFVNRLEIWNPGELPASLTPEGLTKPHASIPHNPLLAQPLFLARYIEQAGTGTLDILAKCKAAGLKAPEFRQDGGSFVQTLWRPKLVGSPKAVSASGKTSVKASGKTSVKIVELIRKQQDITIPEMADLLGKSVRAIEMQINKLKADGIIKRVGPDKGGHWEVIKGKK